jgi:hypothetical protein
MMSAHWNPLPDASLIRLRDGSTKPTVTVIDYGPHKGAIGSGNGAEGLAAEDVERHRGAG